MKTKFRFLAKDVRLNLVKVLAFVLWISCTLSTVAAQPNGYEQKARQILDATNVKGGLIVHIGCGDGKLTAALCASDSPASSLRDALRGCLVHGLDTDIKRVEQAREYIKLRGLYGKVSVDKFDGRRLPYTDNLVNLVVAESLDSVPLKEVKRVLCPKGVAYIKKKGRWVRIVKPWPKDIDEWTHYLHGPDNNAVARDRVVGPPFHLQWLSEPKHLRSHEHLNSVSALVSAGGKIFYIIDEGPTAAVIAPPLWRLVARDAFNGILLWKRDIAPWEGHFRLFRSGPPDIARRLVAAGDRVYATLGYGKRVAAFDATTGQTVRIYDATQGAMEIIYDNGRLFVVVGSIDKQAYSETSKRFSPSPVPQHKGIVAVDAKSGRLLWRRADKDTEKLMPTALAVAGERLFFQNTRQVVCLEAASGETQWCSDRPVYTTRLSWSAPTLVVRDGVVLSADGSTGGVPDNAGKGTAKVQWLMSDKDIRKHPAGDLFAFSAGTGEQLWMGDSLQGFCAPGDVFVIDGLVWSGALVSKGQHTLDVALDLRTGQVKRRRSGDVQPIGGHTRCYRNKATERFLVLGGVGVEFVDVNDWNWTADSWVRGTCQYGVMPCNGLLYVPPDSCACRPNTRLHGFSAMAPKRQNVGAVREPPVQKSERLEKGPVYGQSLTRDLRPLSPDDWPTYRNDGARSGWTKSPVSAELRAVWRRRIGGRLTSLTIGAGKVYVSHVDAHTIYAIDADSGEVAWSRTIGGPVDSPPTVCHGLVVFGCRDGWVYCLRSRDGALVWRFRAAPENRVLMAPEGLESVWPVHGSVLVRDGQVWFAAGRSSYLDGGIRLYALELQSGKPAFVKRLDARDPGSWPTPETGRKQSTRNITTGTLPDILSTSGDFVFMGWTCFDAEGRLLDVLKPHLFSTTGFLDDTWWHRTYWQYGSWMRGGFGGWPQAARQVPAGRLLVVNDEVIFGFGREKYDVGNPEGVHAGHIGLIKDTYQDMGHIDYSQNPYRLFCAAKPQTGNVAKGKQAGVEYKWQTSVPMLVRAMLLANQTLFVAGPHAGKKHIGLAKLNTVQGGLLWAVSAADGKILAQYDLAAAPVLDGMAAAGGQLFIATIDGKVLCLSSDK